MAYTKKFGSSTKVTIDGTDVSNSFHQIGVEQSDAKEPVGAFNSTGFEETLSGARTQRFVGTAWYTEEFAAILGPLYYNRTACVITVQPDGLVDATREIYTGTCYIDEFSPDLEFGTPSQFPFAASPSSSSGISVSDWT